MLIDSKSEVNVMTLAYVAKLGLVTQKINVRAQKIDGSPLEIYGMVSAMFSLQDSLEKVRFFEKTFLLTDISIKMILGMPFLPLSNADVEFIESDKLSWRSYNTVKALPITSRVEHINKKEFIKTALDENSEIYVMDVATLKAIEPVEILIYSSWTA